LALSNQALILSIAAIKLGALFTLCHFHDIDTILASSRAERSRSGNHISHTRLHTARLHTRLHTARLHKRRIISLRITSSSCNWYPSATYSWPRSSTR